MKNINYEWILGSVFIIMFCVYIFVITPNSQKHKEDMINLYKDNCPKLHAIATIPETGYEYTFTTRCYKENNSVVTYYDLTKVNGEYKLVEINK